MACISSADFSVVNSRRFQCFSDIQDPICNLTFFNTYTCPPHRTTFLFDGISLFTNLGPLENRKIGHSTITGHTLRLTSNGTENEEHEGALEEEEEAVMPGHLPWVFVAVFDRRSLERVLEVSLITVGKVAN